MPKVSVIIPVYGVEKYIERCARSLFQQTLDDIEFIFIDDCSPDRSIEVLQQVLEEYPRRKEQVIIHRMEENSGQAVVRTWGMRNATGDYVIHCDSDDWVEVEAYRLMYEQAIKNEADVVVCDMARTDGEKEYKVEEGCRTCDKDLFIKKLLLQQYQWGLCNKLFRRSLYCNDDFVYPEGNLGEDMLMSMQQVFKCKKIAFLPQAFYNYYRNLTSITNTIGEEKRVKNFYQNKNNTDMLFGIMYSYGLNKVFDKEILYVKWRIKRQLWGTSLSKEICSLWKDTYREINTHVIFSRYITLKEKMVFFLIYLGIYPFRERK